MRRSSPGAAALVLRLSLGVVFLAHAVQKVAVLGWRGGIPNFREWGIPLAEIAYPLTVVLEGVGGLLLVLGLWVRPAAAALVMVMLVALFVVHLPRGFFLPGGFEYVFSLAAASSALVFLGPGPWALETSLPRISLERRLAPREAR